MKSKKKVMIALFFAAILINVGGLAVYFLVLAPSTSDSKLNAEPEVSAEKQLAKTKADAEKFTEEYYSIHFNEGDAIDLCENEARSRNSNIIQLSVDTLSTRFVKAQGTYLVKLNSYVGTPVLYDEKQHECTVDPKIEGVAFYKEIMKVRAVRPND